MHALGAYVAVVDLQLPSPDVQQKSQHLRYYAADVSSPQDVQNATEGIVAWSNEACLDIGAVINCAGFLGSSKVSYR